MTTLHKVVRRGRALPTLIAVGLLLGAGPAFADDAAIKRKVEERLAKARLDQTADVQVGVKDGVVTLDGVVTRLDASLRAQKAALKESKTVENRLKVVPDVERKDSEIQKDVEDQILRYAWYTVFDSISVAVQDGVVYLGGSVNQPYRKTDIESRVADVDGLRGISNEIQVQSVSFFDDRLRRQLYRRIYGDDRFVRYANWANPPIRIIVDRGKVTLTGYVNSPVEQVLLTHIANGTLAFGVDNKVKLESDRSVEPKKTSD
jgi:hyperosmotically inducible periplasmic protein